MRLVEVVAGDAEAPDVMAAAFALAKNLKKITVRAGVCDGFVMGLSATASCRITENQFTVWS